MKKFIVALFLAALTLAPVAAQNGLPGGPGSQIPNNGGGGGGNSAQICSGGTLANGDIVVGGPSNCIQDSGQTPVKTYVAAVDPGVNNDITQGFVPGSFGLNTANGRSFSMQSNASGAAVWNLLSPAAPIGWSAGTFAAGSTSFDGPGQGANSTQNFANLAPSNGVFSNLTYRVAGQPGFTIAAAGSGGTAGTAIYSVGGGTCTVQPSINVTVASGAGISAINSVAAPPGNCTVYPSSPAPLTFVSGTGTGVTGATATVNTDVMTLVIGPPVGMTATAVTCTIFGGQTTCQDTTHTAPVVASQAWAVQVVLSAGSGATGQHMAGISFRPN